MNKYYGAVGYGITEETSPGIFTENIIEQDYYGDVLKRSRRLDAGYSINDNIVISDQISIVADPFAFQNFQYMKYATYMGVKWKVTLVEVQSPRLILTLGGVYND